jgi:hypothetical protein
MKLRYILIVYTIFFAIGVYIGWMLSPVIDNVFTTKPKTVEVEKVVLPIIPQVKEYETTILEVDRLDPTVYDVLIKDLFLETEDFKVGDKVKITKE